MANTAIAKAGAKTRFTPERQPANPGRKPDTISGFLKQELASDGYATMEGEMLDENKKPTGKKAWFRVKLTTGQAVAKRLLANANAGRERSIEMVLNRTEGKVPQPIDHTTGGESLNENPLSKLPLKRQAEILAEITKANADK